MNRRNFFGVLAGSLAALLPWRRESSLPAALPVPLPELPLEPARILAPIVATPLHLQRDANGRATHWKSSKGIIAIRDMDDDHLQNAIAFIDRKRDELLAIEQSYTMVLGVPASEWLKRFVGESGPYMLGMLDEAKRRGLDVWGLDTLEEVRTLLEQNYQGDLYGQAAANVLGISPDAVTPDQRERVKSFAFGLKGIPS